MCDVQYALELFVKSGRLLDVASTFRHILDI